MEEKDFPWDDAGVEELKGWLQQKWEEKSNKSE